MVTLQWPYREGKVSLTCFSIVNLRGSIDKRKASQRRHLTRPTTIGSTTPASYSDEDLGWAELIFADFLRTDTVAIPTHLIPTVIVWHQRVQLHYISHTNLLFIDNRKTVVLSLSRICTPHNSLSRICTPHNSLYRICRPYNSLFQICTPHNSLSWICTPHKSLSRVYSTQFMDGMNLTQKHELPNILNVQLHFVAYSGRVKVVRGLVLYNILMDY